MATLGHPVYQTGEARPDPFARQTAGDVFSDPGTALARVDTEDDFGVEMMSSNPVSQGDAHGKGSGAVQRVVSRMAANSVCSK